MRLTVLGGCAAWPAAGQACSGFLVEHDGPALDRPVMRSSAIDLHELRPGSRLELGPFRAETPGDDPAAARAVAAAGYDGELAVAATGMVVDP